MDGDDGSDVPVALTAGEAATAVVTLTAVQGEEQICSPHTNVGGPSGTYPAGHSSVHTPVGGRGDSVASRLPPALVPGPALGDGEALT